MDVDTFVALSKGQPQTVAHYRYCMARIEGWLGKPLPEATKADLVKLKERLRAKRSGWEFAKLLRSYYRACGRQDLVELFGMKATTRKLTESDILTPAEVGRLLAAAGSRRDAAFFGALFETGVRVGELCALKVADAEPGEEDGRQVYRLTFRKVKERGQERDGWVVDTFQLMEGWLKAHPSPKPEAPLFISWLGGRMTPHGALHTLKRMARRAGMTKRVWSHQFKHSAATFFAGKGLGDAQLRNVMGWAPGSPVVHRYTHLAKSRAKAMALGARGIKVKEDESDQLVFDPREIEALPALAPPPRYPKPKAVNLAALEDKVKEMELRLENTTRILMKVLEDPSVGERLLTYLEAAEGDVAS